MLVRYSLANNYIDRNDLVDLLTSLFGNQYDVVVS